MSEEEFKQLENKLKPLNTNINMLMKMYNKMKDKEEYKKDAEMLVEEATKLNNIRLKIVNKLVAIKI
jgi:hypothetical protein